MESKFTIFVVCITVVQNSVATWPSITSAGIQASCQLDFTILQAYKTIAVLQVEKTIRSISAIEHEAYLARAGRRDNLNTTETCKDKLVVSLLALIEATLAPILVVDPEAASTLTTTQTTGERRTTELVESICSAIMMVTKENPSGVDAAIQAEADVHISGVAAFNAAYFEAVLNGRVDSKNKLAFQNAESKSNSELMSGIEDIFLGIKALIPSGTQAYGEDVLSAMETMNNLASSRLTADINVKLGFLQSLLAASCIIELGMVIPSLAIQNNKSIGVSVENQSDEQSEMVSENCSSQDTRQKADSEAEKGMQLIFTTIENELASLKTKRVPEDNDVETAKATAIANYNEIVDIIMDAILLIKPKLSSAIEAAQLATKSEVRNEVARIYDGLITLINERNSPNILSKIQALEDEAIHASLAASKQILNATLLGEIPADIRTKIENAHKVIVSQLTNEWHAVFDGLRIRIAEMNSGTGAECHSSLVSEVESSGTSSFEDVHIEGPVAMEAVVEIIFDGLQTLNNASVEDQVNKTANLYLIQSYRQNAMIKVREALHLVFNNIVAFTEVSSVDENIPEDNLNNIRTGNAGTNAAWKAVLDVVFCQIPSDHPAASVELKNAASTWLENSINITYMSIASTLNSDSPVTLAELHAMEKKSAYGYRKVAIGVYTGVQEGYVYDAEVNATLSRNLENTIRTAKNAARNIFGAIRTLLSAISPGTEAGSKNDSSEIAVFSKKGIANARNWVKDVFDSIELLFPKKKVPDDTCRVTIR